MASYSGFDLETGEDSMLHITSPFFLPADTTNRLFAVSAEIRLNIYDHFVLPAQTITMRFPHRPTDDRAPVDALLQTSKLIRAEALPMLYKNIELLMTPQDGYELPHVPSSITRAMPCFARFVGSLKVEVAIQALTALHTEHWTNMRGNLVHLSFEMDRDGEVKVGGWTIDPASADARETLRWRMLLKARTLKMMMVRYLKEDDRMKEKMAKKMEAPVMRFIER